MDILNEQNEMVKNDLYVFGKEKAIFGKEWL